MYLKDTKFEKDYHGCGHYATLWSNEDENELLEIQFLENMNNQQAKHITDQMKQKGKVFIMEGSCLELLPTYQYSFRGIDLNSN